MALEKIVKNSSGVPTGEYERIAGGTLYADNPIGAIVPFGGTDIPAGFLLCNGAEVLKTDYAELYAVIGDAFGTASVNTKFVLPDLREATTKGAGLTGHTVGNHLDADGLAVGEFLDDRVQTHEHYIGDSATPQHLGYSDRDGQNAGIGNRTVDATFESDRKWIALGQTNVGIARSGRYGDTTEVKSVGVNYIIKAKMVALPADFMSAVDEANEWSLLVDLPKATSPNPASVPIPSNIRELMVEMYSFSSDNTENIWGTYYTRTVRASDHNVYLQFLAYDINGTFRRQANLSMPVGGTSYSVWLDNQGADSIRIYYR